MLDLLAANVRSLRKDRGWSRRDLAARGDISERFLADVEQASANPSLLRVQALARALGVSLVDLLTTSGAQQRAHVALLGLRGAGKSTVGPLLAQRMQVPFVELDGRIEAASGLSLDEIFQVHGESYYRAVERAGQRLDAQQGRVRRGLLDVRKEPLADVGPRREVAPGPAEALAQRPHVGGERV